MISKSNNVLETLLKEGGYEGAFNHLVNIKGGFDLFMTGIKRNSVLISSYV
jgi:hypothetical protein